MQAGHRLSEMLSKARKRDRQPLWIGNDDWATLKAYWGTAEYQILSARNKRNRASEKGGSMHTGGSISQAQYAYRLVRMFDFISNSYYLFILINYLCFCCFQGKKLGREVQMHELHRHTHIKKATGEYVDERSRKTQVMFIYIHCFYIFELN